MNPKKRWACKPKHHPLAQCKAYWMAPPSSWFWMRNAWKAHRMSEATGLHAAMADPETDYAFPMHHRHELAWAWC